MRGITQFVAGVLFHTLACHCELTGFWALRLYNGTARDPWTRWLFYIHMRVCLCVQLFDKVSGSILWINNGFSYFQIAWYSNSSFLFTFTCLHYQTSWAQFAERPPAGVTARWRVFLYACLSLSCRRLTPHERHANLMLAHGRRFQLLYTGYLLTARWRHAVVTHCWTS